MGPYRIMLNERGNAKVLGFDNWTGGGHHFERLVAAFKNRNLDLSLVHLGSWGNDPGRPAEETIGTLPVRDISSYGQDSFPDILDAEDPDVVLFLSIDTFAHRAFNRYCRARDVPTIHLYHGLVRVQAVDSGTPYRPNFYAQLKFASSKLMKAFKFVWPTYMRSLWTTGAAAREWFRFVRDIFVVGLGRYTPVSADDARTDKCCVYAAADVEHAVKKYGFANEDVVVVGNPDLIHFGLTASVIGSHLSSPDVERSDVMYIDTGLIFTGYVFSSEAQFVQHLIDTKRELKKQGKHLVFKPHPDHNRTAVLSTLATAGIDICSNQEFVQRLQGCCACIVEPSTLSVVPALMGMPLCLANYGQLRGCRFGEVLHTYPRSRTLVNVADLSSLLEAEKASCDVEGVREWIKYNAGPLPAELMPDRVAELAQSLIGRQPSNEG